MFIGLHLFFVFDWPKRRRQNQYCLKVNESSVSEAGREMEWTYSFQGCYPTCLATGSKHASIMWQHLSVTVVCVTGLINTCCVFSEYVVLHVCVCLVGILQGYDYTSPWLTTRFLLWCNCHSNTHIEKRLWNQRLMILLIISLVFFFFF